MLFSRFTSAAVSEVPPQNSRLGRDGTTAAFQAFPFVTATSGASACVRERACVCVSYSSTDQEHSLKKRGAMSAVRFFYFAMLFAAAVYQVPVSHRKLSTLW